MRLLTVLIVLALLAPFRSFSQIEFLKRKVQEKIEKKIEKSIDEEDENTETEESKESDEKEAKESKKQNAEPTLETFSKYDFMPGDNVIFYEDFSQDKLGDFPALWFTNGSGEIMTTSKYPGNWFKMRQDAMYYLENGFKFPENFTMEFDVIPMDNGEEQQAVGFDLTLLEVLEGEPHPSMYVPGKRGVVFNLSTPNGSHAYSTYEESNYRLNGYYTKEIGLLKKNVPNRVSIWVQKQRVRMYLHNQKVFDIPKAFAVVPKIDQIRFWLTEGYEPMITNIRIADAGADIRNKLLTEGKIVSYGIYFDTGKDIVKPESYPSLKQIADFMTTNAQAKVQIVGHTDSDGLADKNLALSKSRAEAVKSSLVKDFKIDGSRITTDGKGDKVPISDNKTNEGKAKNRRVEFITSK